MKALAPPAPGFPSSSEIRILSTAFVCLGFGFFFFRLLFFYKIHPNFTSHIRETNFP